ncbi:MAG: hypothetical protein ACE5G1_07865 [bacterium]
MEHQLQSEVIELHTFFEAWLTGSMDASEDTFSRLTEVLADDFQIISPSGSITAREQLLETLRQAHASRPPDAFSIWIENINSRHLTDELFIVTYEEWQKLHTDTRIRQSSAVLGLKQGTANGLVWRHLHETWLPANTAGTSDPDKPEIGHWVLLVIWLLRFVISSLEKNDRTSRARYQMTR